jgi:hypothetical protein
MFYLQQVTVDKLLEREINNTSNAREKEENNLKGNVTRMDVPIILFVKVKQSH